MYRLLALLQSTIVCLSVQVVAQALDADPRDPFGIVGKTATMEGQWISLMPLACAEGCLNPASSYYACFLNTTLADGSQVSQNECDRYLCMSETYDHLAACLNCVVANGNERPYGYFTNSSLTAAATDPFLIIPDPVGGYLNATGANGWLNNVTERCSSIGSPISQTTTLTATPTTTGPYETEWRSGDTINIPTWTGLTEYSQLFVPTDTAVWWGTASDSASASGSIISAAASAGPTSSPTSGGGSTSASAAAVTGSPNSATGQSFSLMLLLVPLLGLLVVL